LVRVAIENLSNLILTADVQKSVSGLFSFI
jgi:hypothetical protein